jgi:hypothetical protein
LTGVQERRRLATVEDAKLVATARRAVVVGTVMNIASRGKASAQEVTPIPVCVGHLPACACVIASVDEDGSPHGILCDSSTSVRLLQRSLRRVHPPPRGRWAPGLPIPCHRPGVEQPKRWQRFSRRDVDRFADVQPERARSAGRLLSDTVARPDCEFVEEHPEPIFVFGVMRELFVPGYRNRADPLRPAFGSSGAGRNNR